MIFPGCFLNEGIQMIMPSRDRGRERGVPFATLLAYSSGEMVCDEGPLVGAVLVD